jgi:putative phage-type endonuclease
MNTYEYKRNSIIHLCIWTMTSEENAKTHGYIRCDSSDSDATLTDDDDDDDRERDRDPTAPYSILPSDEDRETIINDALDELAHIARENILEFKREDFNTEEVVGTWIDSYLCNYFAEFAVPLKSDFSRSIAAEADALNDVLETYIRDVYDEITERFYDEIAPPRVSLATHSGDGGDDDDEDVDNDNDAISAKIRTLQAKPQPEQRTPEWYERRNNLITASAASKAFGTQASVNQLIYEKCKNYCAAAESGGCGGGGGGGGGGSVNSPLHWGQRYEPVTVMVYEHRNRTTLGEFGCIQHDTYPFIGASPDGINIEPASPIYGRMVEIKNIVNREITGRPKEEYWIQTQIQMEVCDLDECDFVETRFKEYDSKEDYDADGTVMQGYTASGNEKGVILWFQTAPKLTQYGDISPPTQLYEYAPIGATPYEYDKWEVEMFAKHERLGSIWVRTIYWYLDQYSCVLVRRNRLWFEEAVPVLEELWKTIEEERGSGFEHRAPSKRKAAGAGAGAAAGADSETVFKIVKLDTAIVSAAAEESATGATAAATAKTPEITATNMAKLMSLNTNNNNNTHKKYGGGGGGGGGYGMVAKRPSDVLINCFKIDELEIDESKVD